MGEARGEDITFAPRAIDMEVYDMLPASVRRALRRSPYRVSAVDAAKMIVDKVPEDRVVRTVERLELTIAARHQCEEGLPPCPESKYL